MSLRKGKKEKNISNNFRNVSEENILQIKTEFGKEIYKNPIEQYNCGGFALGKTIWFELFNWENSLLLLDELEFFNKESYEKALKEKIEKIAKKCVEEILHIHGIRLINSIEELKNNEYAFIFRNAADDFHFMRRLQNGKWCHKQGELPIEEIEESEIFNKEWKHRDTPYCSQIYMFAKRI